MLEALNAFFSTGYGVIRIPTDGKLPLVLCEMGVNFAILAMQVCVFFDTCYLCLF